MNPKDYDFWSVGNEQLSLQNHFPKHIPVIQFLGHSGSDSPETPPDSNTNANANNYTCAEPEILRRSLESALKVAHDEIEKYQLTLNANTAKKLLEATAQGAFRDDPNIRSCQTQQYPRENKPSKLRLMDLFIPPIKEEENESAEAPTAGRSRNTSVEKIHNATSHPMIKVSTSLDEKSKRNSTPSILSSSIFQPPTPNENNKPPLYSQSSRKPPIIPAKRDKRHAPSPSPISPPPLQNDNNNDDALSKEKLDKLSPIVPKNKSQSFSYPSESYTENEQSVTTIKSNNINEELLQLLNKYCPSKNKSQNELEENKVEEEEGKKEEGKKEEEKEEKEKDKEVQATSSVTKESTEHHKKSSQDIKKSYNSVTSDKTNHSCLSMSSSSDEDDEKENIMEDSFLPSSIHKKSVSNNNNNKVKPISTKKENNSVTSSNEHISESANNSTHTSVKNLANENKRVSQASISTSINSPAATENSVTSQSHGQSKSKGLKKKKHKKSIIKDILSPIKNIFSESGKTISRSSSKRTSKSSDNINGSKTDINGSDAVQEDESKYKLEEVLGKGANAVVKLAKSSYTGNIKNLDNEKYYAIKQFRKRRKNEPYKAYIKKVISEFCISSSLKHQNVVETVDLIQDKNENWCEVMEYCSGGDLYTRINTGTLTNIDEMNCYFKQLIMGVDYLHSVGVCHRDIKPENLLMDETGTILKITDFGVSEVFRFPWEKNVIKRVSGLCGSEPYIAPEEWSEDKDYDPIKVDIWACAIVFYTMNHMSVPWRQANSNDKYYEYYLSHRTNFSPIEELPQITHEVLYHMLDPNPETRWTMDKVLASDWIQGITACGGYKGQGPAVSGEGHVHTSKWRV